MNFFTGGQGLIACSEWTVHRVSYWEQVSDLEVLIPSKSLHTLHWPMVPSGPQHLQKAAMQSSAQQTATIQPSYALRSCPWISQIQLMTRHSPFDLQLTAVNLPFLNSKTLCSVQKMWLKKPCKTIIQKGLKTTVEKRYSGLCPCYVKASVKRCVFVCIVVCSWRGWWSQNSRWRVGGNELWQKKLGHRGWNVWCEELRVVQCWMKGVHMRGCGGGVDKAADLCC